MSEDFLDEALSPDVRFAYRAGTLLEQGRSPFQTYEVWDTPSFGKLFRLDGCAMSSERDEFFYHENLVHVPGAAHPGLREVLIIGGGDGGSAKELLKYPTLQRVVVVELDAQVPALARRHLAAVHGGAFDDARVELRVEEGARYVAGQLAQGGGAFDLIILDLTEPVGPAAALYTPAFFAQCRALLRPGGAMSLHLGSPFYQPGQVRELVARLRAVFAQVAPYFLYIPLYGSQWGLAVAADQLDPRTLDPAEVERTLAARGIGGLRYYNGEIHCAQFALPNYLRDLLA